MAKRSKVKGTKYRSFETGIVSSNPTECRRIRLCWPMQVGLATAWFSVQGVPPTVCKIHSFRLIMIGIKPRGLIHRRNSSMFESEVMQRISGSETGSNRTTEKFIICTFQRVLLRWSYKGDNTGRSVVRTSEMKYAHKICLSKSWKEHTAGRPRHRWLNRS
jgi:hypothetical protein